MVKIRYSRYAEYRKDFQDTFVFDPVRGQEVQACRECGKPRQGRFHFYCSSQHREKWERENVPNGWSQMRSRILKRDGNRCTNCGAADSGQFYFRGKLLEGNFRAPLEVDHIKPVKLYPELEYEESNLRTLCHACHLELGERPTSRQKRIRRAFNHMKPIEDFP